MRDDPKLYNTDKEKNLFQPANTDYTDIAEDLTNSGITVDIFAFPKSYIDIATLSLYTTKTGGDFHYFPKFDINTDS